VRDDETVRDVLRRRTADNLRAARERAGLSQPAVAGRMQESGFPYSQQAVTRIESGSRKVATEELIELARIYGVTLDELARPHELAREGWLLRDAARRVRDARDQMSLLARQHAAAVADLERLIAKAGDEGRGEALAFEIAIGRRALEHGKAGK